MIRKVLSFMPSWLSFFSAQWRKSGAFQRYQSPWKLQFAEMDHLIRYRRDAPLCLTGCEASARLPFADKHERRPHPYDIDVTDRGRPRAAK